MTDKIFATAETVLARIRGEEPGLMSQTIAEILNAEKRLQPPTVHAIRQQHAADDFEGYLTALQECRAEMDRAAENDD